MTYNKIKDYKKFSNEEKVKAINIFNTIFSLSDSNTKEKAYLRDYQRKMDRNMGLNDLNDKRIFISKYSTI